MVFTKIIYSKNGKIMKKLNIIPLILPLEVSRPTPGDFRLIWCWRVTFADWVYLAVTAQIAQLNFSAGLKSTVP